MKDVKIGDKIRITKPFMTDGKYHKGDVLDVENVDVDGDVRVTEHDVLILHSEFEVLPHKTEKRHAKPGERVLITNATITFGDYCNGDVRRVERPYNRLLGTDEGWIHLEGSDIAVSPTEYEVIIEEEDKDTEGDIVSKVKVKVGDKIKVTNPRATGGYYEEGDVFTVETIDDDGDIYVEEHGRLLFGCEFEIFEEKEACNIIKMTLPDGTIVEGTAKALADMQKVAAEKSEEEESVKIGDTIKVVKGDCRTGINDRGEDVLGWHKGGQGVVKVGSQGKVIGIIEDGIEEEFNGDAEGSAQLVSDLDKFALHHSEYEVVSKAENNKLKEGDYAKVIGETHFGDIKEGTIVKVDELDSGFGHLVYLTDRTDFDRAMESSLEKFEPTERELSFLRAGRNIDEVEEGDIVEVTGYNDGHFVGSVGIVEEIRFQNYVDVESIWNGKRASFTERNVKLIAPASARVDIDG